MSNIPQAPKQSKPQASQATPPRTIAKEVPREVGLIVFHPKTFGSTAKATTARKVANQALLNTQQSKCSCPNKEAP